MPEMRTNVSTDNSFPVKVEAISWITKFVGGNGTSRISLEEMAEPGDTVRTVLRRLSQRFPELDKALWDPDSDSIGEHIEVVINDAFLGVERDLNSRVQQGDRISLLGQFIGG